MLITRQRSEFVETSRGSANDVPASVPSLKCFRNEQNRVWGKTKNRPLWIRRRNVCWILGDVPGSEKICIFKHSTFIKINKERSGISGLENIPASTEPFDLIETLDSAYRYDRNFIRYIYSLQHVVHDVPQYFSQWCCEQRRKSLARCLIAGTLTRDELSTLIYIDLRCAIYPAWTEIFHCQNVAYLSIYHLLRAVLYVFHLHFHTWLLIKVRAKIGTRIFLNISRTKFYSRV